MQFNINKCILLRFTLSSSPILNNYIINGQSLQCSDSYKYLGMQLNKSLSWKIHITTIINKATRMVNFIKRNLSKCSILIKSTAYMKLVRPILEYATEFWDPHPKYLIHKIEMLQRWTTRWVLSDYNYQSSVSTMLNKSQCIYLEERHKRSRLIQLYKILNGLTPGVQLPADYLPQTTTTRQSHPSRFMYLLPEPLITQLISSFIL